MNQVIYPHYYKDGKRRVYDISLYPQAYSYLSAHKAQLERRTYLIKAKREWYELWVPQNPLLWKMPKIVFPDISVKPRFCYDDSGAIVNGNCYWMCAQTKEEQKLLLLIEGVCNSDLMTKYHDAKFTNKLYSGRRRYLTQYIEQYPIPDPQTNTANQIVSLVEKLNLTSDTNEKQMLESEVNNLVKKAFGIRD